MQTRPRHQDGLPYWAVERTQGTHLLSVSEVVTTLEAAGAHCDPSIHKVLIRVRVYLRCGLRYGSAGLSLISYMADAAMAPVPVVLVLSPEAVRCSTRRDTAVLLAKLHLSAASAGFWKRILVTPNINFSTLVLGMRTRKGLRHTASGDRSYNRRTERRKQPKRQSIEASSAKLRLATERKVAKIGRKKRKKSKYIVRNPKPKEPARDTWRHVHNSSLKRRMSHVGETVVILGYAEQTEQGPAQRRTSLHSASGHLVDTTLPTPINYTLRGT
ncbi:hypothetical protein JB92DRAFT_3099346 [Gautieria morchelliformis]|nr:hypothetical protein JB92DRAFT_3099346 [Gautieria morchelliformis]